MKYAISFNSEGFEIKNLRSQKKTKATYTNCFSSKASARIKEQWYFIEPRTMWGNEFYILRDNSKAGRISQNWQGNIEIEIDGVKYELENTGFINNYYQLNDVHGEEVLTLKPNFQWTRLADDYEAIKKQKHENITLLIYLTAFATHYYEANLYI